jgi:hypothetical protein
MIKFFIFFLVAVAFKAWFESLKSGTRIVIYFYYDGVIFFVNCLEFRLDQRQSYIVMARPNRIKVIGWKSPFQLRFEDGIAVLLFIFFGTIYSLGLAHRATIILRVNK